MSRGMDMERPTLRQRLKEIFLGERPRDRRNSMAVMLWTLLWGASFTATVQILRSGHDKDILVWGLVALSAVTTIMAMVANVRFIRDADEMVQKVYVNALAFGFAAGAAFFAVSAVIKALGGPRYDTNEMFIVMCLAFAAKVFWNLWRNR